MNRAYFDASAFLKLVLLEDETAALEAEVRADDVWVAAEVLEVEVVLATRRRRGDALLARRRLTDVELMPLTPRIRRRATTLPALRALDAIHLATALDAPGLDAFYCYDDRLLAAATAAGLPARSPGYALGHGDD